MTQTNYFYIITIADEVRCLNKAAEKLYMHLNDATKFGEGLSSGAWRDHFPQNW